MKIAVIGTGYVGLVTGTCLAEIGNDVVCVDVDTEKILALAKGKVPMFEPGLGELITRNVSDRRLRFTTDLGEGLSGAEVCFIAVGTPPSKDGSADLQYVAAAVRGVAQAMHTPLVIAIKSTVPVGTSDKMRELVAEVLKSRQIEVTYDLVSNPEFLKEGRAISDFMRPDRIVVGASNSFGAELMRKLYSSFEQSTPFLLMDIRSSEMTKYAANVMLATRISLMNEIAEICEHVGADIMQVRQGVGSDQRIGSAFLNAGVGYGGSCFPKDVSALSRLAVEYDCPGNILEAVDRVNRYQRVTLANRAIARFDGDVRGRRFAMWGLAFKPNTDDVREAPALFIIKRLTEAGAQVCAYDPEATETAKREIGVNPRLTFASSSYDALEGADALLLVTEWSQFRRPDFERIQKLLKTPVIFDGRNQYDAAEMKALGFEYHSIGRPGP